MTYRLAKFLGWRDDQGLPIQGDVITEMQIVTTDHSNTSNKYPYATPDGIFVFRPSELEFMDPVQLVVEDWL